MAAEFTVEQVEATIAEALEAGDIEAIPGLIKYLATIDPYAAETVLKTIEVGLMIAERRAK